MDYSSLVILGWSIGVSKLPMWWFSVCM